MQKAAMRSEDCKHQAALRLKIAVGHLEGVRRMVDKDAHCLNVMKQLSAVQASLERVQRLLLRGHLASCLSEATEDERGAAIIEELMTALKFNKSLTDGGRLAPQEE